MNEKIDSNYGDIKDKTSKLQIKTLGAFFECSMYHVYREKWKEEAIKRAYRKINNHVHASNYRKLKESFEKKRTFNVEGLDVTCLATLIVYDFLDECCKYKQINKEKLRDKVVNVRNARNSNKHDTLEDNEYEICSNMLISLEDFTDFLKEVNWKYYSDKEETQDEKSLESIRKDIINYKVELENVAESKRKDYTKKVSIEFIDESGESLIGISCKVVSKIDNKEVTVSRGAQEFSVYLKPGTYQIICCSFPKDYKDFGVKLLTINATDDDSIEKTIEVERKHRNQSGIKASLKTQQSFDIKQENKTTEIISSDIDNIKNTKLIAGITNIVDVNSFDDINGGNIEIEEKTTGKQQLVRGKKYYDNGKYEEALKCFMKGAEFGNTEAQNCLGIMYYERQNYEKAIECYTKAAEQGNINAIINLADMYYYQDDVNENDAKKAFIYYQKAAGAGDGYAQNQLANCYDEGFGVNADTNKVIKYYEQAAAQGYKEAMANLGRYYYKNGNYIKAKEWATKALKMYEIQKKHSLNNEADAEKYNRVEQLIKEAEKLILQKKKH